MNKVEDSRNGHGVVDVAESLGHAKGAESLNGVKDGADRSGGQDKASQQQGPDLGWESSLPVQQIESRHEIRHVGTEENTDNEFGVPRRQNVVHACERPPRGHGGEETENHSRIDRNDGESQWQGPPRLGKNVLQGVGQGRAGTSQGTAKVSGLSLHKGKLRTQQ